MKAAPLHNFYQILVRSLGGRLSDQAAFADHLAKLVKQQTIPMKPQKAAEEDQLVLLNTVERKLGAVHQEV